MISSLKTPGVYVFEQDAFPPSVAQVATAIPAFVGYTDRKPDVDPNKPLKIKSFKDFEDKYGGQSEPSTITIDLGQNDYVVEESKFKLWSSLRLFFDNGGGDCYIVPIGKFDDNPDFTSGATRDLFKGGIDLLEKVDEVTLIVFPDAINFDAANLGKIQQHALKQCADLMDRFTIMDVVQKENAQGLDADCLDFRTEIGNLNLKYGAAYYPYLKTSLSYKYRFRDINGQTAGKVNFKSMYASDIELSKLLADFEKIHLDIRDNGILKKWTDAVAATPKVAVANEANVKTYTDKLWTLLATLGKPDDLQSPELSTHINNLIPVLLKSYAQNLVDFKSAYEKLKKVADPANDVADLSDLDNDTKFKGVWGIISNYAASGQNPYENQSLSTAIPAPPAEIPDFNKIKAHLDKLYDKIIKAMGSVNGSIKEFELKKETDLVAQIPIYTKIIAGLSSVMNTVPPSGAIAGVYANVDFTRGVWKAPANVTIAGIDGFTADINDKDQESMNIHETGKSVNALRAFTGRGKYVWGARTLDGNSNDWRYINVRRLAIMIEESAKKACFNFVFEPNVKQTWVQVKGMIENFLTILWRDGALAGAKPEHAFFVHVGLDLTMNQDDINNGRMIVKIGYAPSRPAEFILLVFTQKQQES